MAKVYTTAELIQILAAERQACLKGERLNLSAKPSGNPVIDYYLKTEGIQKFTAYQDFKASIHSYQEEYQVSGIVWRQISIKGHILDYPEIDPQLIAIASDLDTLQAAKPKVLVFWQEVTTGMDLYLSVNNAKDYQQVTTDDIDRIIQRTQWATLWKSENINFLEIILQLGWGQPAEAAYKRGFPASGSEYIHAVNPGNLQIC